jgi:hypothetical protein
MRFFKKNPEIKSQICVNGKMLDDSTVVCGEEFIAFANPATFPGTVTRLVEVQFGDLGEEEQAQVKDFADEQASKPPKTLGVVMSENFLVQSGGAVDLKNRPAPLRPKLTSKKDKNKEGFVQKEVPPKKVLPVLAEQYSVVDFIEKFKGVTDKNARQILEAFKTIDDIANASNTQFRKVGVQPNFYERLRKQAKGEAIREKAAIG